MIRFTDEHRSVYLAQPICKCLPIALSTYYAHRAARRDPDKLSPRAKRDKMLKLEVERVFKENKKVYGARKIWREMHRQGFNVARCTVARLMREIGIRGVIRGKPVKTTVRRKTDSCPQDLVNRKFQASKPNALWVVDFTYVSTRKGVVYVAFIMDSYARYVAHWRVSQSANSSLVMDALEQALHDRKPERKDGLIHHSDRGSQYLSIGYTERLAKAAIRPSSGSVGDSYDNALAETIHGLYKAEVIHRIGTWESCQAVEMETLEWAHWFNNRRLLGPIGNIPPAEAENLYYAALDKTPMTA